MNAKKTVLIIISLFALAVFVSVAAALWQKRTLQKTGSPLVQQTETASSGSVELKATAEKAENGAIVTLSIVPQNKDATLMAFDLRVVVSSSEGAVASMGDVRIDKQILSDGWTFPIKRVVSDGDAAVIELSGMFLSKEKFILPTELVLASVPVKFTNEVAAVSVTVDQNVTKFLTRETQPLVIIGPTGPVPVQ